MTDENRDDAAEETTEAPEQTDDATGQDNGGAGRLEFTDAQQAHIDSLIRDRLKRDRARWEKERDAEREAAEQKAEEERLKEKEAFKELAEAREQEIAKLKGELDERDSAMQEQRLRFAIQAAAAEAGIDFTLAWRVIDHEQIDYADDGEPANVPQLIERAVKDFGLVVKDQVQGVPPSPKARGDGQPSDEEKRRKAFFPRI